MSPFPDHSEPSAGWHAILRLGLLCALSVSPVAATDCAPTPIPVRIGNVTLPNKNIRRGVEVSVGTPPQPLAFMPGWYSSNTYVYGTDGRCDSGWTPSACQTFRGGAFDKSASKSLGTPSTDAYPADASPYNAMTYITDTLQLSSDTSLPNFPLGIPINDLGTQAYYPQMTLGLASNSTLLNALKASGKIASRTFSFFAGKMGATAATQSEGGMVFGGYDKSKVTGKQYTSPMATGQSCSTNLVVTITDIQLNFPNGDNESLFSGSQSDSITACLSPSLPVFMNLPLQPYFNKWLELSDSNLTIYQMNRAVGINFWNMRYPPGAKPFNGDVTLKFLTGLTIRVPNNLLVVPDTYISQTTGAITVNSTGPDFLINSEQDVNKNDMAALGMNFLSLAYLMVNQDAGEFSLWAANDNGATDAQPQLVAVDEKGADVNTASCTPTPTPSPTDGSGSNGKATNDPANSPSNTPAPAVASSTGLSTGGIAGVAVGAVAAGALLGVLAVFLLRRRRAQAAEAAAAAAGAGPDVPPGGGYHDGAGAAPAGGVVPPGQQKYYYAAQEMDGDPASAELPVQQEHMHPYMQQHGGGFYNPVAVDSPTYRHEMA